jgi:hypothetical protein
MTMPKTGWKKKENRHPLEIYNSLPQHKQLICWYYFRWIETAGEEGWDVDQAGSRYHYRSSAIVQGHYTPSAFRHAAQSMVTLAQAISQINQRPIEPAGLPPNFATVGSPEPPTVPNLGRCTSPVPTMQSPPFTPGGRVAPAPEPSDLIGEDGGMTCPTSYGQFKKFDYTNRREIQVVMARVLVHGAVQSHHVEFEWINSKKLKYRICWPEFFQFRENYFIATLGYRHDHFPRIFRAVSATFYFPCRTTARKLDGSCATDGIELFQT